MRLAYYGGGYTPSHHTTSHSSSQHTTSTTHQTSHSSSTQTSHSESSKNGVHVTISHPSSKEAERTAKEAQTQYAYAKARGNVQAAQKAQQTLSNLQAMKSSSSSSSASEQKGVQNELNYLNNLAKTTDDKSSQNQIHSAENLLHDISKSHDQYEVVRVQAFIPDKKVDDPRPLHGGDDFHGDGHGFDSNSTQGRVTQEVVVDLTKKKSASVSAVGETVEYKKGTDEVIAAKRASSKDLDIKTSFEKNGNVDIKINDSVGNPLGSFMGHEAPHVKANLDVKIDTQKKTTTVDGKITRYPDFAIYASANGGKTQTVAKSSTTVFDVKVGPVEVTGKLKPAALFLPEKHVHGSAHVG